MKSCTDITKSYFQAHTIMSDGGAKILVIDPTGSGPDVSGKISRLGFHPVIVQSPEHALTVFETEPEIRLILFDPDFPDALALAAAILRIRHIPIIFLTGNKSPEMIRQTESVFSYGYVLKEHVDLLLPTKIRRAFQLFDLYLQQQQAERDLTMEHQKLEYILYGTDVGTWEWNVQTGETIFNERWADIIGYKLNELQPVSVKTWEQYAHPEDLPGSGEKLRQHFRGESHFYAHAIRMRHKKGHWVWVMDKGKVASWTPDGKPLWMYGTHQDITLIKETEQKLLTALEFNKKLLWELKHRVKNSFAMMDSLVQVLRMRTESGDALCALDKVNNALHAISSLYTLLYTSEQFSVVRLDEYLQKVCYPFHMLNQQISCVKSMDELEVPVKLADAIGLITTELITNIIKHAYPQGEKGTVEMSLQKKDTSRSVLCIRDYGPGMPEQFNPAASGTMGLNLVYGLVREFKGNVSCTVDNGTCWRIEFSH